MAVVPTKVSLWWFARDGCSRWQACRKSGDCRPFSDKSDGTLLGEGIAMFAFKRLSDAERDGRPAGHIDIHVSYTIVMGNLRLQ